MTTLLILKCTIKSKLSQVSNRIIYFLITFYNKFDYQVPRINVLANTKMAVLLGG